MTDVLLHNKPGNLHDAQIDQLTAIRNAASNLASLIDNIDVPEVAPVDETARYSTGAEKHPSCSVPAPFLSRPVL
ncbi:MAG: hypothetical protein IH867_07695 [Chloroflexi bacterium]|nr:hypothetical protein [Chloroflexota bacterium]